MNRSSFDFRIIIICAEGLDDVSTNGNLDTFVRVTYGSKCYQSSVIKRSGRNPSMSVLGWLRRLELWIEFIWSNRLHFYCCVAFLKPYDPRFDIGIFRTKLIGECIIDFKAIKGVDNRSPLFCSVRHSFRSSPCESKEAELFLWNVAHQPSSLETWVSRWLFPLSNPNGSELLLSCFARSASPYRVFSCPALSSQLSRFA